MIWLKIIFIIVIATMAGLIIDAMIVTSCCRPLGDVKGFEFMNPVWWYRNYPVNPFGAMMCALGFTITCPVAALGYWLYKLCTVGRRQL